MFANAMTTHPLVKAWRDAMLAQSLSARTVSERIATVGRFASETGTDPVLADPHMVTSWLGHSMLKPHTQCTYHSALVAWFGWLQLTGARHDNPMPFVPKPHRPKTCPSQGLTPAEVAAVLALPLQPKTRGMILLAGLAGFTVHEIAKVRGDDFNHVARFVTVTGRANVVRSVPLHHLITEHAHAMPRSGFWYPGKENGHMRRDSVSDTIKLAMGRAGVAGTADVLRKWFNTSSGEGLDLYVGRVGAAVGRAYQWAAEPSQTA